MDTNKNATLNNSPAPQQQPQPSTPVSPPSVPTPNAHIATSGKGEKKNSRFHINKFIIMTLIAFLFCASGLGFWIYVEFLMQ